uniref:Methyltransferase domain-containing protein n=1 Tax=Panagrolaimus davidi TaxID=227884 RepID=A0A914QES0_9BILA
MKNTDPAECSNLIRIGRIGDGGKWICNPFELLNLENPCIFYSLGLNNEISFDLELMEITKNQCKHIAVDMNEQKPHIIQHLPYTNFLKGTISCKSNETFDEYTLQDLMIKYNTSKIDILKMDIEGSEYSILEQLIKIEICQILIELHSPDKTYKLFYQWLNTMSKAGFYLIHFEINEGTMLACEFTLIHKSCFEKYGVLVIKEFLS